MRLNGQVVTELGTQADPRQDVIEVDGRRIIAERPVYVLLHKPRGVVSTRHDPEGRPTVVELVSSLKATLYPVGRLDFHTSGALLLTNDGDFTQGLLHPKKKVPKIYAVKVQGEMAEADLERWRQGVKLDDGVTAPCDVFFLRHEGGKTWMEVTLHEGRNQQIRRMGEASGFPVMRLARLSFAGITTEDLRPGEFRPITPDELRLIKADYGVPKRIPKGEPELEERPRPTADRPTTSRPTTSHPSVPHPDAARGKAPRGKTSHNEASSGEAPRARTSREEAPRGKAPRGKEPRGKAPARGSRPGWPREEIGDVPRGSRPGGRRNNRSGPPQGGPPQDAPARPRTGAPRPPTRQGDRPPQKSSAAVPSTRAQADRGARNHPPSRSNRPR